MIEGKCDFCPDIAPYLDDNSNCIACPKGSQFDKNFRLCVQCSNGTEYNAETKKCECTGNAIWDGTKCLTCYLPQYFDLE